MRIRSGWVIALGACCSFGCGATGLDWVGEPDAPTASAEPHASRVAMSEPLPPGAAAHAVAVTSPDAEPAQAAAEDHPRLAHTVTLGGDAAAPGEAVAQGAPPAAGQTIVINNYTSSPSYAYPGYGYGFATSRSSFGVGRAFTPASRASNTIQPGQSWAPPAAMGPNFPYHVGPASPWERGR
ncbi:MAG TPA: hypothetical protein VGI10_09215 [Polyangiaceae bacterium]